MMKIDLKISGIQEMYELYGKKEMYCCGKCRNFVGVRNRRDKNRKCLAHQVEYGIEKPFYCEDVACGHFNIRTREEDYPMFQKAVELPDETPIRP